ncbi:MAG: SDR family oxidoreductase [Rhizobiales bacterium]|nr:SDR family oxidoreductase [Hyphomicrobiales bacterium]
MRVLLTGANGFIGSHLTAFLLQAGHDVRAAVRAPDKFMRRFPRAEAVAVDLNRMTDAESWLPIVSGMDAVINCAGILQSRHGQNAAAIHADAPAALFEAAAAANIRKVIQISAISSTASTEYAQTKSQADTRLAASDLDWTILRPSLVYARDAYGGTAMIRALSVCPFLIPVIGGPEAAFSPIHVDDLGKTVLWALENPSVKRVAVAPCGPQVLTLAELARAYRAWFGLRPAPFFELPRPLVELACHAGDLFGAGPVTTTSLRQIEAGNIADVTAFSRATGITPRPVAEMLECEPAGTGELWQARLYLARPLIRSALILMWLASGLIGLFNLHGVAQYLSSLSIPDTLHMPLALLVCLVDIAIGAALAFRWAPRAVFWGQLLLICAYTVTLSLAAPDLWLELFGPLLKNIPILALIIVDRILEVER